MLVGSTVTLDHEELLIGDNPLPTSQPRIMKAHEDFLSWNVLQAKLSDLGLALGVPTTCP